MIWREIGDHGEALAADRLPNQKKLSFPTALRWKLETIYQMTLDFIKDALQSVEDNIRLADSLEEKHTRIDQLERKLRKLHSQPRRNVYHKLGSILSISFLSLYRLRTML